MGQTYPTITPADILLGPVQVLFTPAGGSQVDLGGTTDSATISVKTDFGDIMVDQFGKTILNQKIAGHHFQVKLTFAELADKARIWKNAFPYMELVPDGMGHYLGVFVMSVGQDMLSVAGKLVLHPLSNSPSDASGDYTFELAACQSAAEVKYGPEKQTGLASTFMVYPNTSVQPARFMRYGDTTIGVTGASAGSPTAGGGNTGNGTVTSVTVANAYTKTETVTLTCIGKDSVHGTAFSVVGSLSGNLGQLVIGGTSGNSTNFVSNPINFTMTQGSTEWVFGDSFTIATTAANYT